MEYSITSSDPVGLATINASTGLVTLALDAVGLSLGTYTITLRCENPLGNEISNALLEVERIEENEYSPQFVIGSRTVNISESEGIGSFVAKFTATDSDVGTFGSVSYTLSGSDSERFTIDQTGQVTLATTLDYDDDSMHTILVTASNPATESGEVSSVTAILAVAVEDVNDEPPVFSEASYSTVVQETTEDTPRPGPGFFSVVCTDADSDDSDITYGPLTESSPFTIDAITGKFSVTQDLDYETVTSYSFTVGCWDNGSPNLTSSAGVDILVGSVNEYHPEFSDPPQTSTVNEGDPTGTVIATVTATDMDAGPDGIVTYTLTSDTQDQFLSINLTTGVVYVSAPEELDFDLFDLSEENVGFFRYEVDIVACDIHPPSAECANIPLIVYVLGVNEDPPEFTEDTYSVSYPENTPAGRTIVTASCSDRDRGTGRFCKIEFGVNVGDDVMDTFRLDPDTGDVILQDTLDYENQTSYGFELVCLDAGDDGDCGGNGVMTDRAIVEVTVEPLNDNRPFFTQSAYEFNVSRTTPADRRTVGVASAIDEDVGVGGDLEFTLQANGYFDITDKGDVQIFNSVFNYSSNFLSIIVRVTDGQDNDSALIVIHLTEGNLHSPEFIDGTRAIEVSELTPVDASIISLTCEDVDTGVNGDIRYSIVDGNTNQAFKVDPLTGEVSVRNILVLPQNTTNEDFTLTLSCEDGGVPVFSDLASVFIRVYQDDSLPPDFPNDTIIAFVSEDAMLNDLVVIVEAVDLDSEQLQYRFEDQSVPNVFTIGISTGEVIVSSPLDRETTSVYTMTVVATEDRQTPGPERSDNASLIIYIRDVNDNTPSCLPSPPTYIDETLAAGSAVLQLNCSDPDFAENGALDYSLTNDFGVLAVSDTGLISLNESLSETDHNTLVLNILVSDRGSPQRQVTVQATIFISSVNRYVPTFTNIPATITVSEAQSIQTVFFSVTAEDPDRGSFGEVTYSIVDSTTSDDIGIFSNTGGIYLNRKLDFFQRNEYTLNISAADSDFTVYETLTINVLDENEFSPECAQPSITAQIREGLPPGQVLTPSLSCTDEDIGSNGEIQFTIVSGDEDNAFAVLSDGSIRTIQILDFDNGTQRYQLSVNVSDSGSPALSLEVSVAVVVEAVNEFTPDIEGSSYSASVVENSRIGLSVLQLTVADGDSVEHAHGQLDYELQGLSHPVFQFTSSGELQVAGEIDREEESSYTFTVTVSDGGNPPLSDTANITITVTDVDDNGPEFTEDIYVAVLNGTAEAGTSVITVECTDDDEGANAGIEYSLVPGGDSDFFSIDVDGGVIEIQDNLPVSNIYSISVTCVGTGPGSFSDTAVVSIQVLVDSNITFIPSSSYSLDVFENSTAGEEVLTVMASSSSGAHLSFDLVGTASPFGIDETTGVLQLRELLDYETRQTYTLQVRASDSGTPPNFGDAVIQISVVNVNDETPVISQTPSIIMIVEGERSSLPETIAQYQCSDSDDGVFGDVQFYILSGNLDGHFSLSSSGSLQLIESLDYEEAQSHSLRVVCEDGGDPPRTDSITVPISVTPINDHPPMFPFDDLTIFVTEDLPSGSHVGGPIVATDGDLPPHNDVRYSISSGNDPRTFALSSETGQLSLVQSLDYETTVSYSLVILAQDSGGQVQPDFPVLNDTIPVIVKVLDFNDNPPHFQQDTYSGTISETAQNGDQVSLQQDIECSDEDSEENGQVSLSIVDSSPFTIEDSGLVLVSSSNLLDFEVQQLYILTVTCVDNGMPQHSTTVDLVITVQDVNEFGPEFNASSYTFSVSESTEVGRTIGHVFASDLDAGDAGTISYSVIDSTDTPFDIHPDSGAIVLAESLDYETQPTSYVLQVEASDASSLSDVATVIVAIENEDDNHPTFTQTVYYEEVRENSPLDTLAGEVSCTDEDDAADGVPISYTIKADLPFSLDSNGRLTVAGSLDLERVPRYIFTVNCTDSSQNVAQATLSITLLPYNDHPPILQGSLPYTTTLAENPPLGTIVFDVEALDDDMISYNDITYSFSGGNEEGRFLIDANSGVVTTAEVIDREVQETYVLDVVARNDIPEDDESGSPSLSATTTLTITVTDINDNTPSIQPNNVTVILQVSVSANATVVDLDCTDTDSGENGETEFSITGQFTDQFDISDNGLLTTNDVIEEDVVVIVFCTDNGIPQRSSSARVLIETVSMNDHDPVFPGATVRRIEVGEDQQVGREVACFTAMDADGPGTPDGTLQYSLAVQGTDSRFGIHRDTGCVFVALALDYDETNFYEYIVTAEDMGDPARSASITVQITVLDTIRDPPIVVGTYTRSIPETFGGGTRIVDFLCEDSDAQDMVYYSIIGGNTDGLFDIGEESGRLAVAEGQILDYESSPSHTVIVQCIDTYNLTDSGSVFVTIIPVNEFTPSFEAAQYRIPEHSIGGTVVANLQWEDLDSGRDGEVDFEILSGDPQGLFEITPGGQLLVGGNLDRETQDTFDLEITIFDLSETERRSSSNNVSVVLMDINDNRPQFEQEVYYFGPLEGDEELGHFIGSVSCSDADLGSNAETIYGISSTSSDATLFSINSTGHIALDGSLDMRLFDNITFFVQCTDSGTRPMAGTALVIVPVQEVNMFPPAFSPSFYSTVVPEDTPIVDVVLLTVTADDRDIGVNGRIRFSLEDDFDNTFFIDDTSGELSLLRSLNFEVTSFYELVAVARDGAEDSQVRQTDTANITINVTGVNEFSPFCPDPIYVTIINKTTVGEIVDLECVDDDAGIDGDISYTIISGNDEQLFILLAMGVVSVPIAIEPNEEREQYSLNINVTDMGTPSRVTQVEVIAIYSFDNLDDPDFNETEYFVSVSESTEVGVIVATLTATDSDPSLQGELQYSLLGVTQFRIDSETGELFLSAPLDYEVTTELMFTVVARDSDPYAPRSGSAVVTVAVRNENDNNPRCSQQLYSVTTLSTDSVGENILTLNCSDQDGNPITYSSLTPISNFDVNSTTGAVTVTGPLLSGTTTVFDISVSDGMRSTMVSVSVRVRFSNTEPPVFSQKSFNFTVAEDTVLLVKVGTVSASDGDSSDITYTAVDSDLVEFYVSPESGDLLLTIPLDYETTVGYVFEVLATDGGSHDGTNQLSDMATVTISVENTNDNVPQFSDGGIYGAVVSKSTAVNTNVLDITCTDRDASPYGSPEVTSDDFTGTPFTLVHTGSDYSVRVSEPLLDSISASYFINITCTDGGGARVHGQVFIFVPEPDAPTFSETIYEWLLSENTATGAEFVDVMATSSDMSEVRYDIADGDPQGTFYIESSSGVVTLVSSLDYEVQQTHGLIVRARDGQNRESRVLLLVSVLDVNDQVPLTPPSARLEVPQNSPIGFPIGTLECSDGETDNATAFNFTFIPASDLFSVDQYGVVRLEGELDATPVHVLPVVCSEVDMPDVVSTGVVTVEVVFVNENTPQFDYPFYLFSISEDVATLTYVGTVAATDSDVGSYGEVSYSISEGNPDQFYIESSTGQIGVLTSLDRESTDSYTLTILAVDGGAAALDSTRNTGSTVVQVRVEDANDNIPSSQQTSYIESITTDHMVHSPVLSVVCSDEDLEEAGTVDYSLDPSSVPFSIQSNGTIILDRPQPDQTVYSFDVVCTDRGIPSLSSSALVTVIVNVVELEAPVFDSSHYNVTVSETEPIQTIILRVHAEPSDPSVDIGYQLQSGNDGDRFQVDPSTGDVLIRNPLDASQQQYYTLTIRATNTGRSPLSSFTTVDVVVTDVNDHSPLFSTPFYAATVEETDPQLTPVVQVYCTDEDVTAELTYSISGGHGDPPVFNITQEGLVVTSGVVDYEVETVYDLVVVCSDGGAAPRSTEATVRVEVTPVNEFLPTFLQQQYEFSAEENSFGTEIGVIEATDGDAGSQGEIRYLLKDPGNFSVVFVEPSTGVVLVSNNLDFETRALWNLTVIAQDGGGAESFVPLVISVVNVNDVIPEVAPPTSIATIPHDTAAGYPVQTFSCTDGDSSPTSLSIQTGNDLGYFILNDNNQLIWNGLAEVRLTSITVSLTIECRDEEAPEQTVVAYTAVTVQVGDLLPPEFTSERYEVNIPEDSEVGLSIVNVTATRDGHTIQYSIDELFPIPFAVHPFSGVVTLTSPLDRENSSYYVFPVQARDVVTGALGVTLVAITVTDVNDNRPVLVLNILFLSLSEATPPGIPFTVFQCTDEDEGENGDTEFSLVPSDTFSISEGGQVSVSSPLNFEEQSHYNITVRCSDLGSPSNAATAAIVIEVIGANEHAPVFSEPSYTFNMTEAAVLGTLVGVVTATDSDMGDQLHYDLVGGSGLAHFTINSLGEVRTSFFPTNATQNAILDLVVEASDGLLSNIAVVTVTVEDVNEPPQFPSRGVLALWSTAAPSGDTITEVVCFDTDTPPNSQLTLSLHSNPTGLPLLFSYLGSEGIVVGSVTANETISAGVYSFSLLCSDGTLSSTADVTLRVQGVNNPPIFDHGDLALAVLEAAVPGTAIVDVNATDPEGTDVTYSISSGTGLGTFIIDSSTGEISLALPLDYEVTPDYQFTVSATDTSRFDPQSNSIDVFVYVTNVNDVPPTLSPAGSIVLTLLENSAPMTHVQTFVCSDPEGTHTSLSLTPPYHNINSPFDISNMAVVLQAEVDYERQVEYHITVTCTDAVFTGGDEVFQRSSILIVHITPVNIFSPDFISVAEFTVQESALVGTEIGRVEAVDGDGRVGAVITYTLLTHVETFVVGSESGVITLRDKLDFESVSNYSLLIEASDNDDVDGVTPRTSTTAITVLISDVNDNSPTCVQYLINVVVPTGTYVNRYLAQLLCNDIDSDLNGQLMFSFIDSTLPTFEDGRLLLNSSSGELSFTGTLAQVQTVVIDVNVSDSGQPHREARVTLTIQVQSSSLTEPRFNTSTFNVTITEDTPIDSVIFHGSQLLASLHNPNDDSVSFTLRPNEAHGRVFIINSVTGDISVTGESPLDYDEGLQEYSLIVEASVGLFSPTAVVSVFLTDVNDNPPRFDLVTYHGNVSENQPIGTVVALAAAISAVDIDSGMNREFTYSISGSNNLHIHPETGEVTTLRVLDREALPADSATITAVDMGTPQLSSTALVSITVIDENDVAPHFLQDLYIININNVSPAGTQLLTLTVEDPDEVGEFAFRIIVTESDSDVLDLFTVISPEGILRQKSVGIPSDHQLQYRFSVEVNDGIRTATSDVIINIVTITTATLHILENQAHMFDLKAFLVERGFNLSSTTSFSFLGGNELMDFDISPSGVLTTLGLDREFLSEYNLNINVTDVASGEAANVLVQIIVEDVNDHSPIFPGTYTYLVNETTYVSSTFLGQVEATDMDDPTTRNARLQYSLLVPNNDGFSITPDGRLFLIGTFDREDREQYVFVVRAEDFGEPSQEYGYVDVVVNIVDMNDNNPQFVPPDVVEFFIEIEFSEKEPVGPDSVLDGIIAVLPVVNVTVELDHFIFFDPDSTSTLTVQLSVVQGSDKYKLSLVERATGQQSVYSLVATDFIKPDDHGTLLQIVLSDEPNEVNPIVRNVTIMVTEVTEPVETPTVVTPMTGGITPDEGGINIFTTEIGIAIIVVMVLLGVAIILLFGCLVFYCVVRYRRSKDPLKARYGHT